jgi:hypothetical protein
MPSLAAWSPAQEAKIKSLSLEELRRMPEFDRLTPEDFVKIRGSAPASNPNWDALG